MSGTDTKSGDIAPSPRPDAVSPEADLLFTKAWLWFAIVVGVAAAIVFLVDLRLDIRLVSGFWRDNAFTLNEMAFWDFIRPATMQGYAVFYAIFLIGLIATWFSKNAILKIAPIGWLYLVLCQLLGPLLLTNVLLKELVGRPRPRMITEFDGTMEFIPVFHPGGKCLDNCSFVSGEVSAMTMIFVAMMFAIPAWRKVMVPVAMFAWAFSSYMRIGQGAHFPSDSLFAGVFMIIVAALLYWFMVLRQGAGPGIGSQIGDLWLRRGDVSQLGAALIGRGAR